MRPAGTPAHVYLSPHLDDAVLSCGGALARWRLRGQRVLVVTVCSAVPPGPEGPPGPWHVPTRRAEDAAALAALDVDSLRAELLDAPQRLPAAYAGPAGPFVPPDPSDPLEDQVVALLDSLRDSCGDATLHAPLGIGNHVDHLLCAAAARRCRSWARVLHYEDFPYVVMDGRALRVRQRALGPGWSPVVHNVEDGVAARRRGLAHYASQVDMLFGSLEQADIMLEAALRGCGVPFPAEREWEAPRSGIGGTGGR